ncbi:hypothetical protein OH491_23010 [Termitidicoccus mucosus]|uniref:autotransporter-associated beta strand repeat-containing protein n=1 Tax=Termitidicoccus mucosus TaxID=1184151 RepID=UPI0008389804
MFLPLFADPLPPDGTVISSNTTVTDRTTIVAGSSLALTLADSATLTIRDSFFSGMGGAVYVNDGATFTIAPATTNGTGRVVYTGNTASLYGGAISNSGSVTLTEVTFASNTAVMDGGAIENYDSVMLTNVTFTGNTVSGRGGAIDNWGGTVSINVTSGTHIEATGNTAGTGGFLYAYASALTTFNIEAGATLTIGDAGETNKAIDSIASYNATAVLTKSGAGKLVLHADNSQFTGTFNIDAGAVEIDGGTASHALNATLASANAGAALTKLGGGTLTLYQGQHRLHRRLQHRRRRGASQPVR